MQTLSWELRKQVAKALGYGWSVAPSNKAEHGQIINPQKEYRIALYKDDTHFIAEVYPSFTLMDYFHAEHLIGFPSTKVALKRGIAALVDAINKKLIGYADEFTMPLLLAKYEQYKLYDEKILTNARKITEASKGKADKLEGSKENEMCWDESYLKRWRVYEDSVRIDCFENVPLEVFLKFMENMAEYKEKIKKN